MSPADTRWGSIEAWVDDPTTGEPLPLNGPWSRVYGAHGQVELPALVHVRLLEELEAVLAELPLGQIDEGGFEVDGIYVRTRLGHLRPHCLGCGARLQQEDPEQDRIIRCLDCGAVSNVMPAPWWLTTRVTSASQIIGCERDIGPYGASAQRWFVRFEGEPVEPELHLDPETEEEALSQLGIIEDPKELRRAMKFATDGSRKRDIERQLDILSQRARAFEAKAARRARPWAMAAGLLAGVAAPVALFPGVVSYLDRSGQLPFEGDTVLILEAVSLLAMVVVAPGLVIAQNAVRIWAGVSKREAFNQVGFYAVLGLIPGIGMLIALARSLPLLRGRLPHANVKDSRGRLLRPWPLEEHVNIGWAGIPTALILLSWSLGVQLMWAGLFL